MKEKFEEKNRDIAEGVMMQPFAVAYSTTQAGGTPGVGKSWTYFHSSFGLTK